MDQAILSGVYSNSQFKSDSSTHFFGATKTYFTVTPEQEEEFWISYCQAIFEKKNTYISEVVKSKNQNVQLGYDIFLSFERSHMSTQHDVINDIITSIHSYVKRLIGMIQGTMLNYFEQTTQGSEYLAVYLCRDDDNILTWTGSQVEYRGRIVFPYAFISNGRIEHFTTTLKGQLQLQSAQLNMFLALAPINGLDTLIQPINLESYEMYGSSGSFNSAPLFMRTIYGMLNSDAELVLDTSNAFLPSMHTAYTSGKISRETLDTYSRNFGPNFWLPLFFSNGYYTHPLSDRPGNYVPLSLGPQITNLKTMLESGEAKTQIDRASQLLAFLSQTRVEVFWSWFDIGAALHSISRNADGLGAWKWMTAQSDFKTPEECEEQWYQFNGSEGITSSTLEWFAQQDNPGKYAQFMEKDINDAINKAIFEQQETQVAKAFRACFPFTFICANYESSKWFYYSEHRWVDDDGPSMIMWYLNENFQPRLEKYRADLSNKNAVSRDPELKSRNENMIEAITALIKKLSTYPFKTRICSELKSYYQHRRFNHYMDANPHFTGVLNGVIDLRGGAYVLRPGKPEDFITKTTNCMFPQTFTWNTPVVREVLAYIEKVFRARDLRNYFWRLMGKLLYSGNVDKIFPIWTGEGNNSKSILVRLIEAAFGGYAVKLPYTLITETGKESNKATPVLIHSRGAKVAFLQEPNKNQPIQSGSVKELTGHDTMYVRDLFQKGSKIVEMEITIVPFLITNKIPNIPDCQQAIWERTAVMEFSSRWDRNAPEDPAEQYRIGLFKMDRFFDRQIPRMAPAFLWIMAQKYAEYYTEGLDPPEEVLQATEAFRVSNNKYIHFSRDCITQVLDMEGNVDMSAKVGLDELYVAYRKWHLDQSFPGKPEVKSQFKEFMEMIWRQKTEGDPPVWSGVRIKTPLAAAPPSGPQNSLLVAATPLMPSGLLTPINPAVVNALMPSGLVPPGQVQQPISSGVAVGTSF